MFWWLRRVAEEHWWCSDNFEMLPMCVKSTQMWITMQICQLGIRNWPVCIRLIFWITGVRVTHYVWELAGLRSGQTRKYLLFAFVKCTVYQPSHLGLHTSIIVLVIIIIITLSQLLLSNDGYLDIIWIKDPIQCFADTRCAKTWCLCIYYNLKLGIRVKSSCCPQWFLIHAHLTKI